MSGESRTSEACESCLRHSWLLAMLSAPLSYQARTSSRLLELLKLDDDELLQAIGGSRRRELRERHASLEPQSITQSADVATICRHQPRYPRGLGQADERAPRMLYVAGGLARLAELDGQPIVAIVGTRRATDYGVEMARSLARGLAASGLTLAGSLSDGIAVAALQGALEVDGKTLAVLDGALDACPARRRSLHKRLLKAGSLVAELPLGSATRNWCYTARERTVAALADLMIVVEAEEDPGGLLGARTASDLGRTVAAVPGRVTSPASRGTHALLIEGAALVRGPEDALELLSEDDDPLRQTWTRRIRRSPAPAELTPYLKATLEQVGAGRDTPAKLTLGRADPGEVLLALSELELIGLLTRGDGGRYVPRENLARG